jgi:UDP-N-acetylmuramate--alanine ligase
MDLLGTKQHIHFVGVAGVGMSAIAQYLAGTGHSVSGSDREFGKGTVNKIQEQLQAAGIVCTPQDGSAITAQLNAIVISTAIEATIPDLAKAKELGIPVYHRADMLQLITKTKKTIAFSGTSGKSTTTAMAFHIMHELGKGASLITGAGLVSLQEQGLIGNGFVGQGNWLMIEADESDGTLVKYSPEIGVVLNLDKDHKTMEELFAIFDVFKNNAQSLIVNHTHENSKKYSTGNKYDFGDAESNAGFKYANFKSSSSQIDFTINDVAFSMPILGEHNMENAVAAVTACVATGEVNLEACAQALKNYKGIYRRAQLLAVVNGVTIIDDYAHNPVKIAAAIKTYQHITTKVVAWFQPHGYGPTRFLRNDFVEEISKVLRPEDEIWMSEIFYAGGTAEKNISSLDLINDIKQHTPNAFFVENRSDLAQQWKARLKEGEVLLLMGARDPSLEQFAASIVKDLA